MKKLSMLLLATLTACSGGHLTKPGLTQSQFNADQQACKYQVHLSMGSATNDDPIGNGMKSAGLTNECMYSKGYVDAR